MAQAAEQFESQEVTSEKLDRRVTADSIRLKMARLMSDKEFLKTLDSDAIQNYKDLIGKKGHVKSDDVGNLQKFYQFMEGQWDEIKGMKKQITGHVKLAIRDKVITEKDREFYKKLMRKNVVNGKQNVTREILEAAEKDVLDSLENRRKERKQYDELAESGLVEDGYLIVDEKTKIPFPDEKGYLKMMVPERREWLKKIKKLMPEIKKLSEDKEKAETLKLNQEYETLLKDAPIGDKTRRKFMEWFEAQNKDVKKYAIKQFSKEMERYQVLWKRIRLNLKDGRLTLLEGMREDHGYTELHHAFLNELYDQKLEEKMGEGIINKHIRDAFMAEFEAPSMSVQEKEQYLNQFSQQMVRYEKLRSDIESPKLDEKTRNELLEMYNEDKGWSEINAAFKNATDQSESSYADVVKSKRNPGALNVITSDIKKQAVIEGVDQMSADEKKTTLERFTHIFAYKQPNASSYQKNIRKARLEQEKSFGGKQEDAKESDINEDMPKNIYRFKAVGEEEEMIGGEGQMKDVDQKDAAKDAQVIPIKSGNQKKVPKAKVKTNEDRSFTQSTYKNKDGEKKVVKMHINSKKAIQSFNSEALNRDHDDLTVAALDRSTGQSLELDKPELSAYIEYIRENIKDKKLEQTKKAA